MRLKDIAILLAVAAMVALTVAVIRNERAPVEIQSPAAVLPVEPKSTPTASNPLFGASEFTPIAIGPRETSQVPSVPEASVSAAAGLPSQEETASFAEETPPSEPGSADTGESFGLNGRKASSASGRAGRAPVSLAARRPSAPQNDIYGGSSVVKLRASGGGYSLKPSAHPSSTDSENRIQFETNSGGDAAAAAPANTSQ